MNTRVKHLFISLTLITLCLMFTSRTRAGKVINVPPGGDIPAAINSAQCGDTIVLQGGGVYPGPGAFTAYNLPDKGCTTDILITSSIAPPADGTRVTLADRAKMPKLVASPGAPGFFNFVNKSSHYRLSGLWFTNIKNSAGAGTTFLVGGGNDITGNQALHGGDITQFAHDITIDHCFFNPVDWDDDNQQNLYSSVNYAIELLGANIIVRDSQMVGFGGRYASDHSVILDSGCVLIGTSPGPYRMDNNFCEAWFVGFFVGGGDPGTANYGTVQSSPAPTTTSATLTNVANLQVGDPISFEIPAPDPANPLNERWGAGVVRSISGNAITFSPIQVRGANNNKQNGPAPKIGGESRWRGWNPSNITITHNYFNKPDRWFALNGTDGKGQFEIKACDTGLIDGNTFNGHTGWTVTVRNQSGSAPWSAIRNLTISNNLSVRFGAGLGSVFYDNEMLSTESTNILVTNNLMYGDVVVQGIAPKIFSGTYGDVVQFTHNTILQSGEMARLGNGPDSAGIDEITNFVWRDNITNWGSSSSHGYVCLDGNTHAICTPNYIWTKNVMIGAPTGPLYEQPSLADFPTGNFNPATLAAVGFTDPASGNYRLLTTSPYYRKASDGKDVGVDIDQLMAHLNGPIPVPTPTQSPTPTPSPIPSPTPTPTPVPSPTPAPSPTPSTPQPGLIPVSGQTFSSLDGGPFAYVFVVLSDANGIEIARQQEQGNSYLFYVAPGSYQIRVIQEGYNTSPSMIVLNNISSSTTGLSIMNFTIGPYPFPMGAVMCFPTACVSPTPTPTPSPTPVPTPTPTPVPSPSPTPSPAPSPTLSYCASGQRPGNPPVCKCRNGMAGNSGKCK